MTSADLTDSGSDPRQRALSRALPVQLGRERLLTTLRGSSTGLLALSLLVGAGAGAGAVVFRWLITSFTLALSGHADYAGLGHVANPHVPGLGRWFVLFAPVVAGLLYGPLVHFFAREARGHGVPEVMFAVARKGGRIAPQVAAVKALASALCIGGGGSVGREGPIVQIGSALGSTLGRVMQVSEERMRLLVACGAAGGISATFNAPLAGVFFAMELILRDFNGQAFGMVVLASVTASVIGRAALGNQPFLHLPAFTVDHLSQYLLFALLGLIAGVVGVGFTRVLYWIEDACDWAWRGPEWLRPAVGGLLLGGLLLVLPEMYGVGYPVLGNGIAGKYAIAFLILLLVGKAVATSLTIGIGGSGGVFAPSLFIGAMLGAAYGQGLHHLIPSAAGPAGAYALIGMGAVFAGSARAPITAVVILFELTGEYSIILPLMTAIVLATGVSHLFSRDTIYTLKLRRRGVDLDEPGAAGLPFVTGTAGQVMEPAGESVTQNRTLIEAAQHLRRSTHGQLPVLDDRGCYRGVISARAVADALADGNHDIAVVGDHVELPQTIRADQHLDDALDVLENAPGGVPVLDAGGAQVVGWLTHQAVLTAVRPPRPPMVSPIVREGTDPEAT
ncbi:chloride channel protein [Jatrophihabitans telluris]|uniref:Chloride channel protein n=1 Tax=Jatrophihabitans telluris TaxID=2038343 RepID=A0ABY4QVP1_9ACTN|nr:chloride channel protein [Jatrophihabitans telluris]UQX87054.1 chloride channel protein [Jatrophihabitans telluris]